MSPAHTNSLVERIRRDYAEMPGLKLTIEQACRLWHVREEVCRATLNDLVQQRVLFQTPSGAFIMRPSAPLRPFPVDAFTYEESSAPTRVRATR
jgi:hypothetical protein